MGDGGQERHVKDPLMGLAVIRYNAGPVHRQDNMVIHNGRIVEYLVVTALQEGGIHGKTGSMPPVAKPEANVTACSSAMPTSKKRIGNRSANLVKPVPLFIAAVMAQIRRSSCAKRHSPSAIDEEKDLEEGGVFPVSMSNPDTPW